LERIGRVKLLVHDDDDDDYDDPILTYSRKMVVWDPKDSVMGVTPFHCSRIFRENMRASE